MIQCRACECIQAQSAKCRRCGNTKPPFKLAPLPVIVQRGTIAELEKEAIVQALRAANDSVPRAARALGVGRQWMYHRLRRFGVQTRRQYARTVQSARKACE